jgi:hypothetical protein
MRKLKRPPGRVSKWLWAERAHVLTVFGLVVNAVLIIVTGMLALYAFRQWRTVDDTLTQITSQTPAVLKSAEAATTSAQIAKQVSDASDLSAKTTLAEMKRQSASQARLAEQTNSLATTAVRQLDLSERPILVISDAKLPSILVTDSQGNVSYNLDLTVENKGHSPSLNTAVLLDLIIHADEKSYNPLQEITTTCHKLDKLGPIAGVLIPPGEKPTLNPQTFTGPSQLPRALVTGFVDPSTQNRIVNARLSVCLIYKSSLSEQVHHTGLLYQVGLTFTPAEVAKIVGGSLSFSDAIIVRSDHLFFRPHTLINGIAD